MKIYMGPYTGFFGVHDFVEPLKYLGVSEERRYSLGEALRESWFGDLIYKLNDMNKRKIDIRIDRYDTWNMDYTLALIIAPMLKQLKETSHTTGWVDNEDVPEEICSDETSLDIYDPNTEKKWNHVLDEMIWAFEQIADDDLGLFYDVETDTYDREGYEKHNDRIKNGLRLFGKYYRALWD